MQGPSALLTLLLAGPPLAAPPVDVDRVLALITDGDPEQTPDIPPGPISSLVEAADLAAGALATAEPRYLSELIGYVDTARSLAYQRTGDLSHVRARLAAAEALLMRPDLPPNARRRALKIRDNDRALLAQLEPPAETPQASAPEPVPPSPPPPVQASQEPPASDTRTRRQPPTTIASNVLFGATGAAVIGLIGVQVHDRRLVRDLQALSADVNAAGGKIPQQDALAHKLQQEREIAIAATASLGVIAGITFLTALGLRLWAPKDRRHSRIAVMGSPHGGAVMLHARF